MVWHLRKLKFKMKLGYECLLRSCSLAKLWKLAIRKTLVENEAVAIIKLQKYQLEEDGAPEYLSVHTEEGLQIPIDERTDWQNQKRERLAAYLCEIKQSFKFDDLKSYINK